MMCEGCYIGYGSPKIDSPKVRKLAAMAAELDYCGPYHIVIDDWNINKRCIRACFSYCETEGVSKEFGELMLDATLKERASALGLREGYWTP